MTTVEMTNQDLQTAINETFKLIERSEKIECGDEISDNLDKHLAKLLEAQANRARLTTVQK